MELIDILLLILAGFTAGIVNSVAGGGALVIFPLLISMGISPKLANTTTSIGVYGGQMSSAYGYKKFLLGLQDKRLYIFLVIGLAGGSIGAFALDRTSNAQFEDIAPWFVLVAVILLGLQPLLAKHIRRLTESAGTPKLAVFVSLCIVAGLISLYGGFFGAGMGIVILAILGFTGIKSIHQMNGLKNLMTISINTSANIYFVASGLVKWDTAVILFFSSAVGGYLGSKTASRLPTSLIRSIVVVAGIIATVVLFNR